ncbi:CvpA family protein [Chloroflexota bacterium]
MNWLDMVLLIALIVSAFTGLVQGLIKAVLSLAGLIVGVILASNFYVSLGSILEFLPNETAARIVAYILILITTMIITNILARFLKSIISLAMLGWVNRLGGAIFGILLGSILWGALLAILVKYFGTGLVTESFIAGVLLDKFPLVLTFLPSGFDGVRNYFK